jgi:hypothetical protein
MHLLVHEPPLVRFYDDASFIDELNAHRHVNGLVGGEQDDRVVDRVFESSAGGVGHANARDACAPVLDRSAGPDPLGSPVSA